MQYPHLTLPLPIIFLLATCDSGQGTEEDLSPLLSLAERGDLTTLDSLLADGPPTDLRDACRWTPLMKAALNGHLETVEKLLQADASPHAQDNGGYTAMMLSASNDHADVTSLLLTNFRSDSHNPHPENSGRGFRPVGATTRPFGNGHSVTWLQLVSRTQRPHVLRKRTTLSAVDLHRNT